MSALTASPLRRIWLAVVAVLIATPALVFTQEAEPAEAGTYYYSTFPVNKWLYRGTILKDSVGGRYTLEFTSNGNLMIREEGHPHPLWQSQTWKGGPLGGAHGGHKMRWQADGNFVVYDKNGVALWHTQTYTGGGNKKLRMQSDGNLVVYDANWNWKWHANTYMRAAATQKQTMEWFQFVQSYDAWDDMTDGISSNVISWNGYWQHTWLDWTHDGCSFPLPGKGTFNFEEACKRLDFGYNNLAGAARDFPKADYGNVDWIWRGRNREPIDRGFLDDLRSRCREWNPLSGRACTIKAILYHGLQTNYVSSDTPPLPKSWEGPYNDYDWGAIPYF